MTWGAWSATYSNSVSTGSVPAGLATASAVVAPFGWAELSVDAPKATSSGSAASPTIGLGPSPTNVYAGLASATANAGSPFAGAVSYGTGAVRLNGVDITAFVDLASFSAEFQANRLNSTCKFKIVDPAKNVGGTPIDVREQDEVLVFDGTPRVFGGKVAIPKPSVDGLTVEWDVSCVGFDVILDQRVVQSGLRDNTARYDDDDVAFLGAFCADLGLDCTTYVSRLRRADWTSMPVIDYSGMTVRKALETLGSVIGGVTFWVDAYKRLHWQDPRRAQVVVNPEFAYGYSTGWTLDGSAAATASMGPGGTGDWALRTTGNGSGSHFSSQTITGMVMNRRYMVMLDMVSSVADKAVLVLDWYNGGTPVRLGDTVTSSGTAWNRYKAIFTAPNSTVDRVVVKVGGVSGFTGTVTHDNIQLLGETAAYGVSTTPNGTTVKRLMDWKENREAVLPVNRLLVRGTDPGLFTPTADASTNLFSLTRNGLVNNDAVKFLLLTGGAGLSVNVTYYVISVATDSFKLSASPGGPEIDITTNLTDSVMVYEPYRKFESWRENAASIAYYRGIKYEGVVTDERVIDSYGVDAVAEDVWRKYAFPSRSGSYFTIDTGLEAGTWQIIENEVMGLKAIEYLTTITVSFLGNGNVGYEVTYGEPESDASSTIAAISNASGVPTVPLLNSDPAETPTYGEDFDPPAVPTDLTLTSDTAVDSNGSTIVRIIVSLTHPTDTDYFGSYVELTRDSDGGDPPSPVWTQPMKLLLGAESVKVAFEGVAGNTTYWGRAYAVDTSNNRSAYTAVVSVDTVKDGTAPAQPANVTATAGFRGAAVRWNPGAEADLKVYQLRWGTDGTTWPYLAETRNSIYWVPDLTPGQTYYFQARAVDTSDNVVTSSTDPTPVDYITHPDAGYTDAVTCVPVQVGQADIAAYSVTAAMIATSGLTADLIKSGKIVIRPTGTTALEIRNSSEVLLGFWDPDTGITIYGASEADYARLDDAFLRFYKSGTLTAEMGPDGIWADSIRLGSLPGGHNVVPNSSFEMAAFTQGTNAVTFTDGTGTPGWKAAYRTTTPDNMTEGATLTPTTLAY